MKSHLKLLLVAAFALMIAVPAAMAQTPEASTLPVNEPLDVGGTILQPGNYVIRVLPSPADKNKIQITSPDLQTVYATVLTVPHQLGANEEMPNTMFVYYPAGEGMPAALRTWYAPDPVSQGGHDIVYEESRAKQLARLAKQNVVSYHEQIADTDTTELHTVTPDQTIETYTWTAPVPVPAPEPVVTPAPQISSTETVDTTPVQIAESTPVEMPKTAGDVPLVALGGLLLVGAAVTLRVARKA